MKLGSAKARFINRHKEVRNPAFRVLGKLRCNAISACWHMGVLSFGDWLAPL
jgi:hypothetical protein